MLYDINVNGVRLCYSVSEGKPIFVGVRGSTEDLTPVIKAGVIASIGEQVKAAADWKAATERHMDSLGGSEPDGPMGDSSDGYEVTPDHDADMCDDPLCDRPACLEAKKYEYRELEVE